MAAEYGRRIKTKQLLYQIDRDGKRADTVDEALAVAPLKSRANTGRRFPSSRFHWHRGGWHRLDEKRDPMTQFSYRWHGRIPLRPRLQFDHTNRPRRGRAREPTTNQPASQPVEEKEKEENKKVKSEGPSRTPRLGFVS